MTGRPSPARAQSYSGDHRPAQPSALRRSHRPSGAVRTSQDPEADESTPLVDPDFPEECRHHSHAHGGRCSHGTFSPRPESPLTLSTRLTDEEGSNTPETGTTIAVLDDAITGIVGHDNWKRWLGKGMRTRKMGQSRQLAEQAGFRDTPLMYLSYYIPFLNWIRQYKLSYAKGDFVAACTLASIYMPMALSLAANLAHVPPIHGLYAFVFNPLIYAFLGSCPQMVVGPEAAGSLLIGTIVKTSVDSGDDSEDNGLMHAQVCGVAAGIAGATVLIAGLTRLGFMDSVLSRPFLRGFISAIGFVIAVDQLIPEMGLGDLADEKGVSHGSSIDKIAFMINNAGQTHKLTFILAAVSFVVIMIGR